MTCFQKKCIELFDILVCERLLPVFFCSSGDDGSYLIRCSYEAWESLNSIEYFLLKIKAFIARML